MEINFHATEDLRGDVGSVRYCTTKPTGNAITQLFLNNFHIKIPANNRSCCALSLARKSKKINPVRKKLQDFPKKRNYFFNARIPFIR